MGQADAVLRPLPRRQWLRQMVRASCREFYRHSSACESLSSSARSTLSRSTGRAPMQAQGCAAAGWWIVQTHRVSYPANPESVRLFRGIDFGAQVTSIAVGSVRAVCCDGSVELVVAYHGTVSSADVRDIAGMIADFSDDKTAGI